jgi:hypothetical protein
MLSSGCGNDGIAGLRKFDGNNVRKEPLERHTVTYGIIDGGDCNTTKRK